MFKDTLLVRVLSDYQEGGLVVFDYLSLFPIAQQVIGGCGTLISCGLLIKNIAYRLFKEIQFRQADKKLDIDRIRKENINERSQHMVGLTLNCLRFIPIIGNSISLIRIVCNLLSRMRNILHTSEVNRRSSIYR